MKVIYLIFATMLFTNCGKHQPATLSNNSSDTLTVQTSIVELQPQHSVEEVVGTIRSKQRAVIEAKVTGRILQYLVSPGQLVRSKDRLAEVDARETLARREQATANLDQANKDMERFKRLIATNAISKQDYDAGDARQKIALAALSEAETMLGYASVEAPFDGVITRKLADVGDLAMPGKPLMEIEAPGSLRFEADLPEALLNRVTLNAKMPVMIASIPQPLIGTVSEISPVADATSRTFQVKFDLPLATGLRSGQFGRVSIPVAETNVLLAPATALIKRGQMEMVFIAQNGHAIMRLVKTGKRLDDHISILSGIESGDQIIVSHAGVLVDGQPISTQP